MLDRLKQRLLCTPHGNLDLAATARGLVVPSNELPAQTYLESLAPQDKEHV